MAINNQENCTHDCSTCRAKCSQRKEPGPMFEAPNANSKIGKVIAVVSGKGGVREKHGYIASCSRDAAAWI